MMTIVHRTRRAARRQGLSILEFLGCLSALAGGLVLGSLYLGVNMKEMAYVVLEKAHVVEPRPNASVSQPESPAAIVPAPAESTAPTSAAGISPVGDAGAPAPSTSAAPTVDNPPTSADPNASQAPPEATPPPAATATAPEPAAGLFAREDLITPEQRHALTLAYWDAVGRCMQDEESHRVPAIDKEGNWQLFDYLTGRKDGHAKAAAAIAALDARGVDDHVLAYAKKCRAWHVDGAKLFGRAVDLLTDAPTANLSGPFAQSWQSASTQHRMEARLLIEKQQAVRAYLAHTYESAATPEAPAAP